MKMILAIALLAPLQMLSAADVPQGREITRGPLTIMVMSSRAMVFDSSHALPNRVSVYIKTLRNDTRAYRVELKMSDTEGSKTVAVLVERSVCSYDCPSVAVFPYTGLASPTIHSAKISELTQTEEEEF